MCLGIPGQVVATGPTEQLTATVDICGLRREVNMSCVVDEEHPLASCVGDWVLVHVGFAMSRIDEQEAAQTLQLLQELGEMEEELQAIKGAQGSPGVVA